MEDNDEMKGYREAIEEAKEIKEAFKLDSVDTAILLMIQQDIDQIRFHNTS